MWFYSPRGRKIITRSQLRKLSNFAAWINLRSCHFFRLVCVWGAFVGHVVSPAKCWVADSMGGNWNNLFWILAKFSRDTSQWPNRPPCPASRNSLARSFALPAPMFLLSLPAPLPFINCSFSIDDVIWSRSFFLARHKFNSPSFFTWKFFSSRPETTNRELKTASGWEREKLFSSFTEHRQRLIFHLPVLFLPTSVPASHAKRRRKVREKSFHEKNTSSKLLINTKRGGSMWRFFVFRWSDILKHNRWGKCFFFRFSPTTLNLE